MVLDGGLSCRPPSFLQMPINRLKMAQEIILSKETMSSIEVAELTGKQHSHVMRDIRNMVENLKKSNESTSGLVDYSEDYHRAERNQYKYLSEKTQKAILDFAFKDSSSPYIVEESSYKDDKGELRTMYLLNKKASLLLASGYNVTLRAKIIDRWEALETGKAQPIASKPKREPSLTTKVRVGLEWVKGVSELLNLNESSKLSLLGKVAKPLDLPLPDYTPSKGVLKSASELLKERGLQISSREFNTRAIEKGFLCEMERKSKHGAKKFFKSITKKGLSFGENQVSPHNPNSTQPHWYVEKFDELLGLVGIQMTGGLLNGN